MSKGVIAILLLILLLAGVVLITSGALSSLSNFGKSRANAIKGALTAFRPQGLLGVPTFNFAGGWLKLAILVSLAALLALPILLLRSETRRADRAETQVVIANGNTGVANAGAGQARDQAERTDELHRTRDENRATTDAGVAELERLGHEGATADLSASHRDLVRGLRQRATSASDAANERYCERNPADAGCAAAGSEGGH